MLKNLKQLRAEKGVSQRQLGEAIGTSQQSINKYENHEIEPDISTLISIAKYFNTSVEFLIGNTDIRRVIEATTAFDLNDDEAAIIKKYRQLDPGEKSSLQLVAANYRKHLK